MDAWFGQLEQDQILMPAISTEFVMLMTDHVNCMDEESRLS
jgi:hypothetical protein